MEGAKFSLMGIALGDRMRVQRLAVRDACTRFLLRPMFSETRLGELLQTSPELYELNLRF